MGCRGGRQGYGVPVLPPYNGRPRGTAQGEHSAAQVYTQQPSLADRLVLPLHTRTGT